LKEKTQLKREMCKGCEEVFLRLGQGKHVCAIISAQARPAVECLDFLIVENRQSLRWWSDIRIGHTSSFGEQQGLKKEALRDLRCWKVLSSTRKATSAGLPVACFLARWRL